MVELSNRQIESSTGCQSLRGWQAVGRLRGSKRSSSETGDGIRGGRSREGPRAIDSSRIKGDCSSLLPTSPTETTTKFRTTLNLSSCPAKVRSSYSLRSRTKNFQTNESKHEMARSETDHWSIDATSSGRDARERSYRRCTRQGGRKGGSLRGCEE